jgi:hypothetical protein
VTVARATSSTSGGRRSRDGRQSDLLDQRGAEVS